MNEHDIEDALRWFDEEDQANLIHAARVLYRLMRWTNSCSDGWCYWPKPSRAAKKLEALILAGREANRRNYGDLTDVSEADLKRAFTPIKAFLTRNGTEHSEVFYLNG
jgi:hypothetical protein